MVAGSYLVSLFCIQTAVPSKGHGWPLSGRECHLVSATQTTQHQMTTCKNINNIYVFIYNVNKFHQILLGQLH